MTMHHFTRFALAAVLAVLFFAAPADAQNISSTEQAGGADVELLKEQVEELLERIIKLEQRLDKPMTVKAPFIVTDAKGGPVLKVSKGSGSSLELFGASSVPLRVMEDGEGVRLTMGAGAGQINLSARRSGDVYVSAAGADGRYARLLAQSSGAAFEAMDGGERAQLAVMDGSSRVKLWKNLKPFFFVASETAPSLKLGDEAKPGLEVVDEGSDVTMTLTKGASVVYLNSKTSGDSRVSVSGGGVHRALMQSRPDWTAVEVHSENGGPTSPDWIQLGLDPEEGPRVRIYEGGKKVADLGTPIGKYPGMRIYDDEGNVALHAGRGTTGHPSFSILEDDIVIGSLARNDKDEGVLQLNLKSGQVAAELGRSDINKQTGLRIYDEKGQLALGAGVDDKGTPAVRVINKGQMAAGMSVGSDGAGRVDIASGDKITGMLSSRAGTGVLELLRSDGKYAAQLGPGDATSVALRIFGNSGNVVAGIGVDGGGDGAVRIHNDAGQVIAGLGADADNEGYVSVFKGGGKSLASLAVAADGRGSIQVYSASGETLGTLTQGESGGGLLQLNNAGGAPMVEAGTTGTVGVVRAGPTSRASGLLGLPGSYIVGKQ
jgi:hypothetical protein